MLPLLFYLRRHEMRFISNR